MYLTGIPAFKTVVLSVVKVRVDVLAGVAVNPVISVHRDIPPPEDGVALVHALPLLVKTLPDVPGAISDGTVIFAEPSKATPFIVFVAANFVAVAALPVHEQEEPDIFPVRCEPSP